MPKRDSKTLWYNYINHIVVQIGMEIFPELP